MILHRVKGGFAVNLDGVKAFLPGSLVDTHAVQNPEEFENIESEFKIIKVDHQRNNIVVSRRAVIEAATSEEREKLLEGLGEGQILKGIVKNLTDYGAFIDLGGVDGLLHITDISWQRIKSPSDALKIGDKVTVVVLKFDKEQRRISLGMKQLTADPWINIQNRYPKDTRLKGKVTNIADYGCFVEIEPGIEGLVHMSEMDWTNKNVHPNKLVHLGDEVEVMILDVDEDKRRISLGMKQCYSNPWSAFAEAHTEGETIRGTIKSITDFGIFVGLEGNIDGLVHLSDISWTKPGEQAIRDYQKEQEIEVIILSIDVDRERISLGIKQLQNDPFGNYVTSNPKGTLVKGMIKSVEEKQAWVELAPEVTGRLKAIDFSDDKIENLNEHLKEGDEIEARVFGINRKDRLINLSVKAKESDFTTDTKPEEDRPPKPPKAKAKPPIIKSTFGDLIKEKIEEKKELEAAEAEEEEVEEFEEEYEDDEDSNDDE
jgi:small subunit ribosomal protein S1